MLSDYKPACLIYANVKVDVYIYQIESEFVYIDSRKL